MFFLRGNGRLWCLPCAMVQFAGIITENGTPENTTAFITNVRNGWESDQQGGVLEEMVNTSDIVSESCSQCRIPLVQLLTAETKLHSEKHFVPLYDIAELTEYRIVRAAGEEVLPPLPEWVPSSGREVLPTDLDPAQWSRWNYVPFEATPVLTRNARVLVVLDEKPARYVHGTLMYVNDDFVLIQLDEKRTGEREASLVNYPMDYSGLYIDSDGSAHYQTLCGLCNAHLLQFTVARCSGGERQVGEPGCYHWKWSLIDSDQGHIAGVADTYRDGIEQIYRTLCLYGYIDDPDIEEPAGVGEPV